MRKVMKSVCSLICLMCLVVGLVIIFGIAGSVDNGAEYGQYAKQLVTAFALMLVAVVGSNLLVERR